MKKLLLLLLLSAKLHGANYAWQTNQVFYWFDADSAGIALSTNVVAAAEHAASIFNSCQIGNSTGILTNLCTAFEVVCQEQNCTWKQDHRDIYNDAEWHVPCRAYTNGITYIANINNVTIGTPVVWFSHLAQQWISATTIFKCCEETKNFADGMTGQYGIIQFEGQQPIPGDSSSPVFTLDGDYIASVTSIYSTNKFVCTYMYPNNATLRPVVPNPGRTGSAVVSQLNSDPDR